MGLYTEWRKIGTVPSFFSIFLNIIFLIPILSAPVYFWEFFPKTNNVARKLSLPLSQYRLAVASVCYVSYAFVILIVIIGGVLKITGILPPETTDLEKWLGKVLAVLAIIFVYFKQKAQDKVVALIQQKYPIIAKTELKGNGRERLLKTEELALSLSTR